ncbi:MAG: Gfo/Idh/MocA family oxidoreductase [Ilumatobacteraceae bacterium]
MDGAPLRVGLVGCGRWGRLILRDLVTLGAEVHVVVRPGHDLPDLLGLRASSVVVDVSEMPEVDGVVVATPTSVHAESVERVLPLGVPLFVEKPFTDDPERARKLADQAGDRLFVMDKWRYHPGVRVLRDLVASGRLGTVRELRTVRLQNGMPHTDVDCSWILLPHDLALALEIMGSLPRPTAAAARWLDGVPSRFDVDFEFPSGATMHTTAGIDADSSDRQVVVSGTRATAVLAGGWEEQVTVTDTSTGNVEVRAAAGELPLLAELRAFVDFLGGGSPPPVSSAVEGARSVQAIADIRAMAGVSR